MKIDWDEIVFNFVVVFTIVALLLPVIALSYKIITSEITLEDEVQEPLQNVVCDTSYGVQYFDHKGVLTLRVNSEGKPIKCYDWRITTISRTIKRKIWRETT